MLINSLGGTYYAGEGLNLHPGNEFAISDPVMALILNAIQESQRNAPDGFVGLDFQSTAFAAVRVLSVDHLIADELVPRDGELLVVNDTKELRFGDGFKQGGFRAGMNSKNMIYVGADGTAVENGAALTAAYNLAINTSPNGITKSATNRMYILLGCGIFESAELILSTPFIDIIGLDMLGCRVKIGATIPTTNTDFALKNLTFFKSTTTHNFQWSFTDTPVNIYWENLRFEGIASDLVIQVMSRVGAVSTSQFNGIVKNVKTACAQLLSGASSVTGHTVNLFIEDCEAGNKYISGQVGNHPLFAGTMRNCVWNNTTATVYELMSTARLYNSYFGRELNFCNTGSRIEYCRFKPAAGVPSIKGTTGTQNVFAAHNIFSATALDSSISNTAGVTPLNLHTDA